MAGGAEEVQRWFKKHVTYEGEAYTVDLEQAEAIFDESKNTIVVARAGSGKTRTIVAKIVYLIAKRGVKSEEIMAFVFNANAAKEINERLAKMMVDGKSITDEAAKAETGKDSTAGVAKEAQVRAKPVKIASTFHAFSRKIVYDVYGGKDKCGKILAGEKDDFVQMIVEGMLRERKWYNKIRWFIRGAEDEGRRKAPLLEDEVKGFARVMATFVSRAQQKFLAGENTLKDSVAERLEDKEIEYRERVFVEAGAECYRRYHWYLLNGDVAKKGRYLEYGTDFNLLVAWAGKIIAKGHEKVDRVLSNKRYLLIDEYQDFSQLFLSVVMAIRRRAPEAKLFVVGDDWQAINRFAGSDVEYFKEFERYFREGARRLEITTNYRCNYEIVETARKFMQKAMREKGKFRAHSKRAGRVMVVDSRYTDVADVIEKERKAGEILILHRNNEPIEKLEPELRKEMRRRRPKYEFRERVKMMTMHKSKGLEAEVVIILEADEGIIPKTHPDTRLYAIFGETEGVAMDDQKRLFYVAMTRAKKRLYIMHEKMPKKVLDGFIPYLGHGVENWDYIGGKRKIVEKSRKNAKKV